MGSLSSMRGYSVVDLVFSCRCRCDHGSADKRSSHCQARISPPREHASNELRALAGRLVFISNIGNVAICERIRLLALWREVCPQHDGWSAVLKFDEDSDDEHSMPLETM